MVTVSLKNDVKAGQAVLLCWFRLKHLIHYMVYRYIHDPTGALINLSFMLQIMIVWTQIQTQGMHSEAKNNPFIGAYTREKPKTLQFSWTKTRTHREHKKTPGNPKSAAH